MIRFQLMIHGSDDDTMEFLNTVMYMLLLLLSAKGILVQGSVVVREPENEEADDA